MKKNKISKNEKTLIQHDSLPKATELKSDVPTSTEESLLSGEEAAEIIREMQSEGQQLEGDSEDSDNRFASMILASSKILPFSAIPSQVKFNSSDLTRSTSKSGEISLLCAKSTYAEKDSSVHLQTNTFARSIDEKIGQILQSSSIVDDDILISLSKAFRIERLNIERGEKQPDLVSSSRILAILELVSLLAHDRLTAQPVSPDEISEMIYISFDALCSENPSFNPRALNTIFLQVLLSTPLQDTDVLPKLIHALMSIEGYISRRFDLDHFFSGAMDAAKTKECGKALVFRASMSTIGNLVYEYSQTIKWLSTSYSCIDEPVSKRYIGAMLMNIFEGSTITSGLDCISDNYPIVDRPVFDFRGVFDGKDGLLDEVTSIISSLPLDKGFDSVSGALLATMKTHYDQQAGYFFTERMKPARHDLYNLKRALLFSVKDFSFYQDGSRSLEFRVKARLNNLESVLVSVGDDAFGL